METVGPSCGPGLTEYLGVEWGDVRYGTAEIRGVPAAVIEHFSKRRAQSARSTSCVWLRSCPDPVSNRL